jgi:acyl phosphate:glycerol-3-phosphate acyltransferase
LLTTYFTIALVSYLLGSIPFGYILVKLFLKQDIRQTGSGNIGATNVARSGAKGLAIATLLLDAGKGLLAVISGYALRDSLMRPEYLRSMEGTWYWSSADLHRFLYLPLATAALFAVLGHCFPIWLRFKGGKGVATGLGAFLVVSPLATGVAFLIFIAIFAITRYVSLGSIIAAAAFPIAVAMYTTGYPGGPMMLLTGAASAIIILKHHENIRRLLAGTEPKFGTPKAPADPIRAEKNA